MKNKITEADSKYRHLEEMPVSEILTHINDEDQLVPLLISEKIDAIGKIVHQVVDRLKNGGRLFYIGAGTSGRLGILDASECPPTFGVSHTMVIGLIAGGDRAIRKAVEMAEDDEKQAWIDLEQYDISPKDFVIGIAASGTTPYVVGGIRDARKNGIGTGCITCNLDSPLENESELSIVVPVGPEFVTGSTRMKAGTAQKLILNMISTATMICLGRIEDNKMVDMQLSNNKLHERAERILMQQLKVNKEEARKLLDEYGSVRQAKNAFVNNNL